MNKVLDARYRKQLLLNPTLGAGNYLEIVHSLYPEDCQPSIKSNIEIEIFKGKKLQQMTVHQLYQLCIAWAKWYREQGINSRDPVAVYCNDGLNYIIHFTALNSIGAIAVLTNGAMQPQVAANHFKNIRPAMVMSDDEHIEKLPDEVIKYNKIISISSVELTQESDNSFQWFKHKPDCPVMITHSSGTTGTPKAIILHHRQWFHGIRELLKNPQAQGADKYLNALPSSHNSSIAFIMHSVLSGNITLVSSNRDGESVADLIESFQPSTVAAFPQTWVELALYQSDKRNFSSVNTWINSGDAAHEVHIRKIVAHGWHLRGNQRVAGSQFVDGLGSSEMGHISIRVVHTPYTSNYGRCVGFAQDWANVLVFDEQGQSLPRGEIGMLGVQSPSITPGYWNDSILTYKSRIQGYWLTGDLVYIDDNDRVFHVDRVTDKILTSKGICYSLLTEECILSSHPALEEVTIIGAPDANNHGKLLPVVFAVQQQKKRYSPDELLVSINTTLRNKGLTEVWKVQCVSHSDIPKGITGKVLKNQLREKLGNSTLSQDILSKYIKDTRANQNNQLQKQENKNLSKTYHTESSWQGTLAEGKGKLKMGSASLAYSVPANLGGLGKGTNPEELLLSAASSCFAITLGAIFQFKGVAYQRINVKSKADFENSQIGPQLRMIRHHVKVTMFDQANLNNLSDYIKAAEQGCMVSVAMAGNSSMSVTGSGRIV